MRKFFPHFLVMLLLFLPSLALANAITTADQFRKNGDYASADTLYRQQFAQQEKQWLTPKTFEGCPDVTESDPQKALGKFLFSFTPQNDFSRRTAQCYFQQFTGKIPFTISGKTIEDTPELAIHIMLTESMDAKEKQYWFDLLPAMNRDQTARLYRILSVETNRLHDLDVRFNKQVRTLSERHKFEWELFELAKNGDYAQVSEHIEAAEPYDEPTLLILQAGVHRMKLQLTEAAGKLEQARSIIELTTGIRTIEGLTATINLAVIRLEQGDFHEFIRLIQDNDLADFLADERQGTSLRSLTSSNIWISDSDEFNRFFTNEMKDFSNTDPQAVRSVSLIKEAMTLVTDPKATLETKRSSLATLRRRLLDGVADSRLVVNRGCNGVQNAVWSGNEEYTVVQGNKVSLCSRDGDRLIIAISNPLPVITASLETGLLHVVSGGKTFDYDTFTGQRLKVQTNSVAVPMSQPLRTAPPEPLLTALSSNYLAIANGGVITLHSLSPLQSREIDLAQKCTDAISQIQFTGKSLVALCGSTLVQLDPDGHQSANTIKLPGNRQVIISSSHDRLYVYSPDMSTVTAYAPTGLAVLTKIDVSTFEIKNSQHISHIDSERLVVVEDSGAMTGVVTVFPLGDKKQPTVFDEHFAPVRMVSVADNVAASITGREVRLWSLTAGKSFWSQEVNDPSLVKIIGNTVLVASDAGIIRRFYLYTGEELQSIKAHNEPVRALSSDNIKTLTLGADGAIKVWRHDLLATAGIAFAATETATVLFTSINEWIVIDREGRFDTNNLDEIGNLHWLLPDDKLKPLPFEVFMKEYYEPRLLVRLLSGERFKPVRLLHNLNRVQPNVKILSVRPEKDGTVSVQVEVARERRNYRYENLHKTVSTGVHDVKLLRDGRLVAFKEGEIALDVQTGKAVITFCGIRLPRQNVVKKIEFAAYGFNDDGIKSQTSRKPFVLPKDLGKAKGKVYLITIGVSRYQNQAWNMSYAASDASLIRKSLEANISDSPSYSEVIPVMLTDENATKAAIKGVFELMSGHSISLATKQHIPQADRIIRSTPDDLVLVSFSGHGFVDSEGSFHLLTYDTGTGENKDITSTLITNSISNDELSRWLLDVDAGDMTMIVDACHSAATVANDTFKPGPMGSRGLGQLAYDKGMRILAATQVDNVALESDDLRQGLLSYVLIREGLDEFKADHKPKDGCITLGEWLGYAVERVPELYRDVQNGKLQGLTVRGFEQAGEENKLIDELRVRKRYYQTPALFDFTRKQQVDVPVASMPVK